MTVTNRKFATINQGAAQALAIGAELAQETDRAQIKTTRNDLHRPAQARPALQSGLSAPLDEPD